MNRSTVQDHGAGPDYVEQTVGADYVGEMLTNARCGVTNVPVGEWPYVVELGIVCPHTQG